MSHQIAVEQLAANILKDAERAPLVVSAPALRLAAAIQMLVEDLYSLHKQVDALRRTK
jgi:hypothetical protein